MKFEAQVRDLASDGRGIVVSPEGESCFVAGVWRGETVYVEKRLKKSKVAEAKLLDVIEASDARRDAPCRYHGHGQRYCGGCAWQFVSYDAQLEAKQQRIEQQIARIIENAPIKQIKASPEEWAYRNRAQLKSDGQVLGFEASQSHALIEITDCLVLSDKNRKHLQSLLTRLPNKEWQPKGKHHKTRQKVRSNGRVKFSRKKWTTLDIDESLDIGEVSVNQRLPFQQANTAQNSYMQEWLRDHLLTLDATQEILELFCGSGNFTDVISANAKACIRAIELDERAVSALNARQLAGVKALTGNLFDEAAIEQLVPEIKNTNILVLDPPRDGFKLMAALLKNLPRLETVFYISCDLASFCRDTRALLEAGFEMQELQPLDLFPQTPHVETLACFKRM